MCGIFGVVELNGTVGHNVERLRYCTDLLKHRGPDAAGEWYDDRVYLGHRRLSIIDLSEQANQPFHSQEGTVSIIYNGEIYNYKDLAKSLYELKTNSDTEVILEGYIKFGVSFFKKLRGIFAFSIYDRRTGEVLLYRDLSGIKPLYYSHQAGKFSWASEIKSIRAWHPHFAIDEEVLQGYLSLGYCIEPRTIYKEVKAVRPGECVKLNLQSGQLTNYQLDSYSWAENNLTYEENKLKIKELLSRAIERNCVSDVDIMFSLSGGIDSSLLFGLSSDRFGNAINVQFADNAYDESSVAKSYASMLKKNITCIDVSASPDLDLMKRILLHFDQPYADSSAIPFYFLSQAASAKTKVLIGGDGGDEIHNGYPGHSVLPLIMKWQGLMPLLSVTRGLVGLMSAQRLRQLDRIIDLMRLPSLSNKCCAWQSWLPTGIQHKGKPLFKFNATSVFDLFNDPVTNLQADTIEHGIIYSFFYKRMLSDYLRKSDMMSMMNSLEYRVPMLDEDLVQFSLSIPYEQKSTRKISKRMLRDIHSEVYPSSTSFAKKKGFGIPLDTWLSAGEFGEIRDTLKDSSSIIKDYLEIDYVDFLFENLSTHNPSMISREAVYQRIFLLYSLQLWHNDSKTK